MLDELFGFGFSALFAHTSGRYFDARPILYHRLARPTRYSRIKSAFLRAFLFLMY